MCFIYRDVQYFLCFDEIIILCASAQFYAKQFSSLTGFYPDRGGVEAMGQTASLLAKGAPSLQNHSSIESRSLSMTIFLKLYATLAVANAPKLRTVSTSNQIKCLYINFTRIIKILKMATPSSAARRGRSCAGPQKMSQPLLKICRTLYEGRHKTGPCVRQTWQLSSYGTWEKMINGQASHLVGGVGKE